MRVKLCARCPYLPCDLAGHYDPEAVLHLCTKCDGEHWTSTKYDPLKAYRRQKCATVPNIVVTAQPSIARSVTEGLALFGTTPGEPPSVQRNAPIASRTDRRATAGGCVGFRPLPDNGCGRHQATARHRSEFRSKEVAQ
jgi:hypothetical protein